MKMTQEFNTSGYDYFMGRAVPDKGLEKLTFLNLDNRASINFFDLETALSILCDAVKKREKVLLSKSPGYIGPAKCDNSEEGLEEALNILKLHGVDFVESSDNKPIPENAESVHFGCRYMPLSTGDMKRLERMYETRVDMKTYPNPFLNQPESK